MSEQRGEARSALQQDRTGGQGLLSTNRATARRQVQLVPNTKPWFVTPLQFQYYAFPKHGITGGQFIHLTALEG